MDEEDRGSREPLSRVAEDGDVQSPGRTTSVQEPAARRSEPVTASPSTAAEPLPPNPPAAGSRRPWLRSLLFLLLPLALAAGGYWYVVGGRFMSTDNAYVRSDMVTISTDVSGIVMTVAVADNQAVRKGDVLFTLDEQPFRFALARAEAKVGIVRNDIEAMKASYHDKEAEIREAQADVEFRTSQFNRQETLSARDFASRATLEEAKRDQETARQKVLSLQQELAAIAANLAGDPEIAVEQHPRFLEAVAERNEAARQLAHTTVRAPMDGIVTNVPSLQPGHYLQAADPAFSVVATDHVWIEANPKETQLTNVLPGQEVTITVDTYPGVEWRGTVESLSPASSASFSLLPAQNTSGNWVKVVQRIPLRVKIDTPADKPPLRVGMSVEIEVDTGHPRGLPQFVTDFTELFGRTANANE